jgi:hypothetical protein
MGANANTVLQVNFKTHGDSLINIYADTPEQFNQIVEFLKTKVGDIAELESNFKGAAAVAQAMNVTTVPVGTAPVPPPPPVPVSQPGWGAPQPPAPTQSAPAPTCAHGPRTAKSGQSGKGPWRAWMCPTPKGTPGQCDPQWVKQGTPEWNAFPA